MLCAEDSCYVELLCNRMYKKTKCIFSTTQWVNTTETRQPIWIVKVQFYIYMSASKIFRRTEDFDLNSAPWTIRFLIWNSKRIIASMVAVEKVETSVSCVHLSWARSDESKDKAQRIYGLSAVKFILGVEIIMLLDREIMFLYTLVKCGLYWCEMVKGGRNRKRASF